MGVELTPEQAQRFKQLQKRVLTRQIHPFGYFGEKEHEILQKVRDGLSNQEITRQTGACDQTINTIKKRYGLWGV